MGVRNNHYAMIEMAHVADDYPLYYEAFNEKGLGMAGLNFVGNAAYNEPDPRGLNGEANVENVAVFEFIPWILSQCATVDEAKKTCSLLILPIHSLMICFHVLIFTGLSQTRKAA